MEPAQKFRAFAQECTRWAAEARDDRQRQLLLDLAKQWMQAALHVERIVLIDDDPPLVPKDRD